MGYIVGTAGHVDHGKTALVQCLTGKNTAHIPEEKKRGMTIELGFAPLQDPVHGTVGIVDVPGHERFIRNMVAGMWGLDAALLIVAADDGWMQMSTEHLRVLKALRVTRILLVITKADLADDALLTLVTEDAQRHCQAILGKPVPSIAVSSVTGSGIPALKQAITRLLADSSTAADKRQESFDKPFLAIDRVFPIKGIGIAVTGTLRGGLIRVGDTLTLYPGTVPCRIRTIQSHYQEALSAEPGSRVALTVKIAEKQPINRGMLIAGEGRTPVLQGTHIIIRIDEQFSHNGTGSLLKNHSEIELAVGSVHAIGAIHITKADAALARISLQNPIACHWNQHAVIIRHGGSKILGSCRVLAAFDTYNAGIFKSIYAVYAGRNIISWHSFVFFKNGYIEKDSAIMQELSSNTTEVLSYNTWWVSAAHAAEWEKALLACAEKKTTGFTLEETGMQLPQPLVQELAGKLCTNGKLIQRDDVYLSAGIADTALSETAQHLLALAEQAGFEGIEIDKISLPNTRKSARELVKRGKLIVLEDFLHYHHRYFEQAAAAILKGKSSGMVITIADARSATGLSRKYVLPLLNTLERQHKLARSGSDRIVL
ncbi:MAG: selenocysteine-specific translation elongation factor [Treponema sp.]